MLRPVGSYPRERKTGLLLSKNLSSAPETARKFGKAGADFVKSGFSEEMAFKLMSAVYEKLLVRIKA